MPDVVARTLILAVPGTQETHELELDAIRAAVARGEIAPDNWAWSPSRNEWLPLAQLPEYATAEAPSVRPVVATPSHSVVKVTPVAQVSRNASAVKVTPKAVAQATPKVAAGGAGVPVRKAAAHHMGGSRPMAGTFYAKPIQEHHEFPIFKVLFFVMGFFILALIVVNYFMVDQPFRSALSKTAFSNIDAHAHLGAFVQPNALLIHIIPNAQLNDDDFADFLTAIAQSAPRSVLGTKSFSTMGLTSQWLSQYMITADDWDGFADMSGYSLDEKKQYVLLHLEKSDGSPVYSAAKNQDATAQHASEDAAWNALVANFSGHGG